MSFYCVYCNQIRNNTKKTPQEKTKEHFIPQSIGGRWTIPVCSQCNSLSGKGCDGYLASVSWIYKFYAGGVIETQGTAILLDDSEVNADFKIQQKSSSKDIHFHHCFNSVTKQKILKKDIRSLKFKMETIQSFAATYPAILKIALGGIYYLVTKQKKWTLVKPIFQDLTFARWREAFLGGGNFSPGGIGQSSGPTIKSLSLEETKLFLRSRTKPLRRRHIIKLEQSGGDLKVLVCLFSELLWEVTLPNVFLIVDGLEEELLLHQLTEIELETAGNIMRINENIFINVILH